MKVDKVSKVITNYEMTDASVHDSQVMTKLVDERDTHHEVFADSAYEGKKVKAILEKRKKSSVQTRIEHVFAFMTNTMRGLQSRSMGSSERVQTSE